jgi:hypothetical protein
LKTEFHIKSGEKEMTFYLHNLLLEIATIDRDENPLRFDDRLVDFDYFAKKTARIIESKLKILFKLLSARTRTRKPRSIPCSVASVVAK